MTLEKPRAKRPRPNERSAQAMASIKEVAQHAGVSKSTVSNTLNRPEIVMPETRERVLRSIAELGFIPNQQARQLNGVASQVIGLVVIEANNPFFMEAARAIEDAASEADHVMILCNSAGSKSKEEHFLRLLAGQRVRGVILTPASGGAVDRAWLDTHPLPIVFLDHRNTEQDCSVSVDDVSGGALAAEHLLGLGHERIVFVGNVREHRQHAERLRGATGAVAAGGLDPATALVNLHVDGMDVADGLAAVDRILAAGAPPAAIFCANDVLAFGVYRGLAQRGIRAPEDVALMGYDDIDFAADWIVPLTSIRQPTRELGTRAAQLLLAHSSGDPSHTHEQIVLQPTLSVRQSTVGV